MGCNLCDNIFIFYFFYLDHNLKDGDKTIFFITKIDDNYWLTALPEICMHKFYENLAT